MALAEGSGLPVREKRVRWCWRVGNVEWRIEARTQEESRSALAKLLGLHPLAHEARFIGMKEEKR